MTYIKSDTNTADKKTYSMDKKDSNLSQTLT